MPLPYVALDPHVAVLIENVTRLFNRIGWPTVVVLPSDDGVVSGERVWEAEQRTISGAKSPRALNLGPTNRLN
jgi:hypothetical protein